MDKNKNLSIVLAIFTQSLELQQMVPNLKIELLGQLLRQLIDRAMVELKDGVAIGANQVMMTTVSGNKALGRIVEVEGAEQF